MNQKILSLPPQLARKPKLVEVALISQLCKTERDALNLTIKLGGYGWSFVADVLGIDPGQMSRIRHGKAHFPTEKIIELQWLCGNTAFSQFIGLQCGFDVKPYTKSPQEEIAELRAELEALRAAAN